VSAKNHIRYLLIIVTIVCILGTIGYVQYENKKREYTNFSKSELETIPLFDALNENVAQGLPPLPQGSSLLKKWSVGINAPLYEHGRWLFMKFPL
jgi:hypothetical protein